MYCNFPGEIVKYLTQPVINLAIEDPSFSNCLPINILKYVFLQIGATANISVNSLTIDSNQPCSEDQSHTPVGVNSQERANIEVNNPKKINVNDAKKAILKKPKKTCVEPVNIKSSNQVQEDGKQEDLPDPGKKVENVDFAITTALVSKVDEGSEKNKAENLAPSKANKDLQTDVSVPRSLLLDSRALESLGNNNDISQVPAKVRNYLFCQICIGSNQFCGSRQFCTGSGSCLNLT